MTTYVLVEVSGTVLDGFDPALDSILFPDSASPRSLILAAAGAGTLVSIDSYSVLLSDVAPEAFDGAQFIFGNASVWRQGAGSGDSYVGTLGEDAFDLRAGGSDTVTAGEGDDVIDLGNTLDAADEINGEGGQADVVRLAGGYEATVVLGETTIRGIEQFTLGTGGTIRLQLDNSVLATATPAASQSVVFDATAQTAADAVYLDGSMALKEFQALMGAGNDTVQGGARNDTLQGGGGVNILAGHGGNDRLEDASLGQSTLFGGAGDDVLAVIPDGMGTSGLVMAGGTGADTLVGGEGNDQLYAAGWQDAFDSVVADEDWTRNRLAGGGGNDVLWGDAGRDTLRGGAGDDTLLGGLAQDDLEGGMGDDSLDGGDGNDTLDGGEGWDVLAGGAGEDDYTIRESEQQIVEAADGGYDAVRVYAQTYTLSEHVEYAQLTGDSLANADRSGRLVGNAEHNELVGWNGNDTLEGGEGNDTLRGGGGTNRLVGGAGDDVYDLLSAADVVVEGVLGGTDTVNVASNGTYTLSAEIENANLVGWGAQLVGNAKDNVLTSAGSGVTVRALEGNDTMAGGGNDVLMGGVGNDTYLWNGAGVVRELVGEGTDTLIANVASTVWLQDNVENLTLKGAAWEAYGNKLANVIRGTNGLNILYGLGGADTLVGGGGNDVYHVTDTGDVVVEAAGGGTDRVIASVDYTLRANVENLYLFRYGEVGLRGKGNALDNTLTAATDGNDTLDGGAGADTMDGGVGDDTYIVDSMGDVLVDSSGWDTVRSSVNFTLGSLVDVLILMGGATQGKGNANSNEIRGNDADNLLDGGGGVDTLLGGNGNDTYVVDHPYDRPEETSADGGVDTVSASVSFTLPEYMETLVLTGRRALAGTGNEAANLLVGNDSRNRLAGGAGVDTLRGGLGDDSYVTDGRDVIVEAAGGGTDTVLASQSYTLGARLENLTLTGLRDIAGNGNALANVMRGNAGDNLLDGGAGVDTMDGGDGADVYAVDNAADVAAEALDDRWRDVVVAGVDYTLDDSIDDLVLAGTAVRGIGSARNNGLQGNDRGNLLDGGIGNDSLWGGAGNDTLIGGWHGDDLFGGAGSDVFVFRSASESTFESFDLVFDFARGVDRIDLSQLDGDTRATGRQALRFVGEQTAGQGGDVWYEVIEGGIALYVNTDADKYIEVAIAIAGVSALDAVDFLL